MGIRSLFTRASRVPSLEADLPGRCWVWYVRPLLQGDSLEGAIVATVAYFDVFAFAPYPGEIHRFLLGRKASRVEVEAALRSSPRLTGVLGSYEGAYFLIGKDHLALRRSRFTKHA